MIKVLVVDLGSRLNPLGGQARIASTLSLELNKKFDTYYLGYDTDYLKEVKNKIILPRGKTANPSLRKSVLSEMRAVRIAYNLLVVSRLGGLGVEKGQLVKRVKSLNPDIIISNAPNDFPLLRYLKRNGVDAKTVYVDHGSISTNSTGYFSKEGIPITFGTGIRALTSERAKEEFFNFFDMVVALNRNQYNSISDYTEKVRLINNGVNIKRHRNQSMEKKARRIYGIKDNDFVVLYVGRMFDRQKNVSTLIKAFKEIKGNNFKLLLVGDGPSINEYKSLSSKDGRITFTGKLVDEPLNTVYNLSHVFVLPSHWEGLSLVILEAAAVSLPLILSNAAYSEDFKDKRIGKVLSFNENNPEELKGLIQTLKNNKKVRDHAIHVSNELSKVFDEETMIGKYTELIHNLSK